MADSLNQLRSAAEQGDLQGVEAALKNKPDMNGRAPLTYEEPSGGLLVPRGGKSPMAAAPMASSLGPNRRT